MKNLITLILLILSAATASAQTMRDSLYQTQVPARVCVIIYAYSGVQVRDTMTVEDVSAWIAVRGLSSADSTRPIQDGLRAHLRTEIDRCRKIADERRDTELAAVDAGDTMTITQYRAAKTEIRRRYRSIPIERKKAVPVLDGAAQVAPGGEVVK